MRGLVPANGFLTDRNIMIGLAFPQLIACVYFMLSVPLHYDEYFSWRHFSGNSLHTVLTFYPAPNNHVAFNVASVFFVSAGIPAEIAVRIPALIASVAASCLFFRLCRLFFSRPLSALLAVGLVTSYHFLLYSFEGRGYGFVNLFVISLLFSSTKLAVNYQGLRSRALFILSVFGGLWSMPSFLYPLAPVLCVLFGYVIMQRSFRIFTRFAADGLIAAALVVAGYSGILTGDATALLNPETWANKFSVSDRAWFHNMMFYFDARFEEVFGAHLLKTTMVLVISGVLLFARTAREQSCFLSLTAAAMFFSPFFILILHRIYPFGRTLSYLVIPGLLAAGFLLEGFKRLMRSGWLSSPRMNNACIFLLFALLVWRLMLFPEEHRGRAGWDYELAWARKYRLHDLQRRIGSIGRTDAGAEFYAADVISHFCVLAQPGKDIKWQITDTVFTQDLVVVNGEILRNNRHRLRGYRFLYEHDDTWIYVRENLVSIPFSDERS